MSESNNGEIVGAFTEISSDSEGANFEFIPVPAEDNTPESTKYNTPDSGSTSPPSGAEAWKQNILISMIPRKDVESGKYPGAHVFSPVKGLNNKRPVTGLDFASLYPSIFMTYNFSSEMIILEEKTATELQQKGIRLHKIEFTFNGRILQA
ncbi:4552_t:CDS:2, partial [Acaulospora colombiana]